MSPRRTLNPWSPDSYKSTPSSTCNSLVAIAPLPCAIFPRINTPSLKLRRQTGYSDEAGGAGARTGQMAEKNHCQLSGFTQHATSESTGGSSDQRNPVDLDRPRADACPHSASRQQQASGNELLQRHDINSLVRCVGTAPDAAARMPVAPPY